MAETSLKQPDYTSNAPTRRERLANGIQRAGEGALSLLEVTAGISLAKGDLKRTREAMQHLDEQRGGLIERQSAPDAISMALEADILLDFRRDAQKSGHTDTDAMPDELRAIAAETASKDRYDDIADELHAYHPDWTPEEVASAAAVRAEDISTLLSMDSEQRDDYQADMLQYQEYSGETAEINTDITELRAERDSRFTRIGRVATALSGVANFASKVRAVPGNVGTHVMVARMSAGERLSKLNNGKGVLAVAVAGLAGYAALRYGADVDMDSMSASNVTLVSSETPLIPDHIGEVSAPEHVGGTTELETEIELDLEPVVPDHIGGNTEPIVPDHIGGGVDPVTVPDHIGGTPEPVVPDHIGGTEPTAPGANPENSSAASTIDPGEGWYQTFEGMGIPQAEWNGLIDRVGPNLPDEVAYFDTDANEWRIRMTADGKMPEAALDAIRNEWQGGEVETTPDASRDDDDNEIDNNISIDNDGGSGVDHHHHDGGYRDGGSGTDNAGSLSPAEMLKAQGITINGGYVNIDHPISIADLKSSLNQHYGVSLSAANYATVLNDLTPGINGYTASTEVTRYGGNVDDLGAYLRGFKRELLNA